MIVMETPDLVVTGRRISEKQQLASFAAQPQAPAQSRRVASRRLRLGGKQRTRLLPICQVS